MKLLKKIKHIIYADQFVIDYKIEEEQRNQRGIALIAIAAFMVMSILNIKQQSYPMLATTSISAVFLTIGYLISKYRKKATFLRVIFYIIFVAIFTSYTIMGGNEGFAVLWILVATYAVMSAIDFKAGFMISTYYFIMLLLIFIGPLKPLLQYKYNQTFMLRFPFLYAINYAFATFIVIRMRMYQYEVLIKQQALEKLSSVDLSTGVMNRNHFIQREESLKQESFQSLSVVFIDVNGLHEINNLHGHGVGDKMLRFVADACKRYYSNHEIYRMGGDEFLILCINETEEHLIEATQSLLDHISEEGYSISYGVETQTSNFNLNQLVKCADDKMIAFKKSYYHQLERNKRS